MTPIPDTRSDISRLSETRHGNIDVHIRNVRKKLGDARMDSIVTVRGVGYKFESNPVS